MKVVLSEKTKKKLKEDKEFQESYWRMIYPDQFADDMTSEEEKQTKTASRKISVPLKGVLRQTKDGFVYVDISNDVIHGLFQLIDEEGIEKPPYMNDEFNNVGAHISVIGKKELTDKVFTDSGKVITFKMGRFYSVEPEGWEEMERVWFIEVDSPDLENIREKYGLSKKHNDHEYHITIAVKRIS